MNRELIACLYASSIRWGLPTKIINIDESKNVIATLDNWILNAKLTAEEREKIDEEITKEEKYKPSVNQSIIVNAPVTNSQLNQPLDSDNFSPINMPIKQEIPHSKPPTTLIKRLFWKLIIPIIIAVIAGLIIWKLTTHNK